MWSTNNDASLKKPLKIISKKTIHVRSDYKLVIREEKKKDPITYKEFLPSLLKKQKSNLKYENTDTKTPNYSKNTTDLIKIHHPTHKN